MTIYLSRKTIEGYNNKDLQKDLDKGVYFGNTFYLDELENVAGLILQYKKKKYYIKRNTTTNIITTAPITTIAVIGKIGVVSVIIKQKRLVALYTKIIILEQWDRFWY